jgi:predicted ATPase
MLKELRIENFKAFGNEQQVPLAPITLIYGPNSSGKSSIIQSLLLLYQSFQGNIQTSSKLIFRGEYVDLGSFLSVLFQHDTRRPLNLAFRFSSPRFRRGLSFGSTVRPRDLDRIVQLTFELEKERSRGRSEPELTQMRYSFSDPSVLDVGLQRVAPPQSASDEFPNEAFPEKLFRLDSRLSAQSVARYVSAIQKDSVAARDNAIFSTKGFQKLVAESEPPPVELVRLIRNASFAAYGMLPGRMGSFSSNEDDPELGTAPSRESPSAATRFMFGFSSPIFTLSREFYDHILALSYLGPLRSPPERHYIVSGADRESVGTRGERMPQLLFRRRREGILKKIDEWFSRFSIPYQVDVKSAGNDLTGEIITVVLTDRNGVSVSPSDVGFGIGQLLPIVVEGMVSIGKLICVEQPEIHLHPRLQAHIADFLIDTAKTQAAAVSDVRGTRRDVGGNQWIVETHSEALMLRFQRRIKEKMIPPEFLSVLYVEPNQSGSRVLRIRLSDDGSFIDDWPQGFFEEGFNEIFGGS